jgi:uncharacterized protein YicC (UPF0701 family)
MENMNNLFERIHALKGTGRLHVDAALQRADDEYRAAREATRYADEDVRAAAADDREAGLLQTSRKTDEAQARADAAAAKFKTALQALEAERKRYGKIFLADLDGTATEVGELTLALANAVDALRGHAFAIAAFASQNGLPIHRSLDHAANLDSVARRLRFMN